MVIKFFQRRRGNVPEQDEESEYSPGVGAFDFLANVGAIVYVEMSLKWNNITGVHSLNSPGQFMPFFIALGQFFSVFYSAAKYGLRAHADDGVLEGDDGELPKPKQSVKILFI